MEKKLNLFDLIISGIPVWWFARDRVLSYLFKLKNDVNISSSNADSLSAIEIFRKLVDSFHINVFDKHDILTISTSSARRIVIDEKDFDVFFDFISWTKFGSKYALIETPDLSNHSKNPYTSDRYIGDYLSLKGNLFRRVAKIFNKGHKQELTGVCADIYKFLKEYKGVIISEKVLLNIVLREVAFARVAVEIAGAYIEKIRPKVVLVECGYSPSHMAFQLAAKKRNIPVFEIQHGLIVQNSLGYFFGLRDGEQLNGSPFPDKIIVFGEHFKKILLSNSFICDSMVIVGGHPVIHAMKKKYQGNIRKNGRIMVTTQPELHDYFEEMVIELERKISNEIIVKPHPAELSRSRSYSRLKSLERVSVVNDNISLFDLLSSSEFHLSAASMTHLEAICFGLKDIMIMNDGFAGYYKFLVDMGLPVAYNVKEIVEIIRNYPSINNITSYVCDEIFSLNMDSVNKIEYILEQYVS